MNEDVLYAHYKAHIKDLPQAIVRASSFPIAYIFRPMTKQMFEEDDYRWFDIFHNRPVVLISAQGMQMRSNRPPKKRIISEVYKRYLLNKDFKKLIDQLDNRIIAVELTGDYDFYIHDVFDREFNALLPDEWDLHNVPTSIYEVMVPDKHTFDFVITLANRFKHPIVFKSYNSNNGNVTPNLKAGIVYPIRNANTDGVAEYIRFMFGNTLSRDEFEEKINLLLLDDPNIDVLYQKYLERVSKWW